MKSAVQMDARTVSDIEFQAASLDIWDAKYKLSAKDGSNIDESIDDTYRRVAKALSDVEKGQTKVAFAIIKNGTNGGYVFVRGDNGQQIRNCGKRANCTYDEIDVFQSNHPESSIIHINCFEAGGCIIVGKS